MQSEKTTNVQGNRDKNPEKESLSPDKHWKERLSRLSFEEQEHIAKKYYGGQYPWKG